MKKPEKKTTEHMLSKNDLETQYLDNAQMKIMFKICSRTLYNRRKKKVFKYCKIGGKYYYPIKYILRAMRNGNK